MTTIVGITPESLSWRYYKMPCPLNFNVRRAVVDNIQFFRPVERIERFEFEEFFHFGAHCEGYDENRVVIKDSSKPQYSPVTYVIIDKDGFWRLK